MPRPLVKWKDFKEAIKAMEVNDLLVWNIKQVDLHSAHRRMSEMNTESFHVFGRYIEEKFYMVRTK